MDKKAKFELVVRVTGGDGKLLHEVAVPVSAEWNFEKPALDSAQILGMTQYDVIENMAKHLIEAAEKAPIRAMMVNLICEASEKGRQFKPAQTCSHGKTSDCHDYLVDEACGRDG